jgi:hypothetical protein
MNSVRSNRAYWKAFPILALILAAPARLQAQDGVVTGLVVVSGSQRALPGVQVSAGGQPGRATVTDGSGRFRLTGLTGSQVELHARVLGYRRSNDAVRARPRAQ